MRQLSPFLLITGSAEAGKDVNCKGEKASPRQLTPYFKNGEMQPRRDWTQEG